MSDSAYPQPIPTPDVVQQLADACGGTGSSGEAALPDGSGFAVMSIPLPKNHWAIQQTEEYETPPMVFRMGSRDRFSCGVERSTDTRNPLDAGIMHGMTMTREGFANVIREAGKYAYRASTMQGKEPDLDPDALLQNLVVAFLGYWTANGLSSDDWANPPQPTGPLPPQQ